MWECAARTGARWLPAFCAACLIPFFASAIFFLSSSILWFYTYVTGEWRIFPRTLAFRWLTVTQDYAVPPGFTRMISQAAFWLVFVVFAAILKGRDRRFAGR
jgi:hypothetical protein